GLGHFYDLSRHPGVRTGERTKQSRWEFLDQEDVRRGLVDFSDDKITRITLQIPAIHCIACVWLLENLFQLHSGIGRSRVNFLKREVTISFATAEIKLSEIVALLTAIGYEPSLTLGE